MKDYYKLLGVKPGDSMEKIKEAHRRLRRLYTSQSLPLYSIYEEDRVRKIVEEIDQAAEVLLDPEKRKKYNLELLSKGIYSSQEFGVRGDGEEKELDFEENVTGGMLFRRVRELKGIDLKDVARVTRIQVSFLKAIEEEKFEELPARVFVRGFVMNYARFLKLKNIDEIVKDYMKKYDEWDKERK